jgi:hypothetical protein
MNSPRIVYVPRPGVTSESELSVLANVYAYLIKTHDSKRSLKPPSSKTGEAKSSIRRKEARMT